MCETERCSINTIQKSDYQDIQRLFKDPDVRKYLGGIRTEAATLTIMDAMLNPAENSFYWTVREKQTDHFIGLVSLDPHHDGLFHEVSYQFLPNWWGKGYASETVRHIINYTFSELKFKKIVAETQTANIASCKLLEKLGMSLERKVHRFGVEQAIYSTAFFE